MSRHVKKASHRDAKTAFRPAAQQKALALLMDGYANQEAFLGSSSALFSSGTFLRSELSHNYDLLTTAYRESWLAKRIIDMPCDDMTRAWYKLSSASIPMEDLYALQRLEARHNVKQELTNAIRWARLYGGSLALIVLRGEEDQLDQPVDPGLLLPDCFQGLLVLDRSQGISPSVEKVTDLDDPDFGLPEYYTVPIELGETRFARIHHSRVLRFVGRELPLQETEREDSWGASELEHVWDELLKRSSASANIAQLLFQANLTTLKMSDFGEMLVLGTERQRQQVMETIAQENRLRTSYGLQLISKDDQFENHPYSFAGISDVYELFMMDMAGAAEIPATKLFGRSPQGLNSTGESDLRNYYELIAQLQERILRPALDKLLPIMALSAWGEAPEDLEYIFEPVTTTSPKERAELSEQLSAPVITAYEKGIISREEAVSELKDRGLPFGLWTKLPDLPSSGDKDTAC